MTYEESINELIEYILSKGDKNMLDRIKDIQESFEYNEKYYTKQYVSQYKFLNELENKIEYLKDEIKKIKCENSQLKRAIHEVRNYNSYNHVEEAKKTLLKIYDIMNKENVVEMVELFRRKEQNERND